MMLNGSGDSSLSWLSLGLSKENMLCFFVWCGMRLVKDLLLCFALKKMKQFLSISGLLRVLIMNGFEV